jgi:hypothetical protein
MSSTPTELRPSGRAERQFREAFDRLKRGKPRILPKGSKLTQNNVAKEAGVDPSALRRVRFPEVVAEIQQWIQANRAPDSATSPRQMALARRSRNRGLRGQLAAVRVERDEALSKLVDAEAAILYLTVENDRLKVQLSVPKVTSLRPDPKSS